MEPGSIKTGKNFLLMKKNLFFLLGISLIGIIYFSLGINSWKFAFVGDVLPFYDFAKGIADKNFLVNPFDMNGVYSENRVLGSIWQAIFIKLFSHWPNFGWRFSNIILIIPINFLFFYWIKSHFGERPAKLGTAMLTSSFYLANFFKIGNLMPSSLFCLIACLYLANRTASKPSLKNLLGLAIVLGLSFYIYIGPIFPLIIGPYLLFLLKRKLKKKLLGKSLLALSIYLLIILIGVATSTDEWLKVANKTVIKREFESNWQIVVNVARGPVLFYKNYDYFYNHFVAGPYVDRVTGSLLFLGLVMTFKKVKQKKYLSFLLVYFMTNLVVNASSPYWYAATTRGIFFLPFGFALAGLGLAKLERLIDFKLVWAVLLLIFLINLYESQIGVFKKVGYHRVNLILREIKENKKVKLILANTNNFNKNNIFKLVELYKIDGTSFKVLKSGQFNCNNLEGYSVLILEGNQSTKRYMEMLGCEEKVKIKSLTNYY